MLHSPEVPLADGRSIPQLGLGVYKVDDAHAAELVTGALAAGYRHVDTATLYGNERGVGEGVRASGVTRDDVFVTTKVWNADHGYDETLRAFETSLELLGFDFVDLYLIHWPVPSADRYVDTWRALVRLREQGLARSIGVSNFEPHHVDRIVRATGVPPVVDQVESHPWLPQHELLAYGAEHGVAIEAWSPLARGRVLDDPTLAGVAAKHGVTPAQVVIRWHVQRGVIVIPKSNSLERIVQNADVFGFVLDDADLAAIAGLESGERTGRHPDLD